MISKFRWPSPLSLSPYSTFNGWVQLKELLYLTKTKDKPWKGFISPLKTKISNLKRCVGQKTLLIAKKNNKKLKLTKKPKTLKLSKLASLIITISISRRTDLTYGRVLGKNNHNKKNEKQYEFSPSKWPRYNWSSYLWPMSLITTLIW